MKPQTFGGRTLADLQLETAAPVGECTVPRETLVELLRAAERIPALETALQPLAASPCAVIPACGTKWNDSQCASCKARTALGPAPKGSAP